MKQLYAILLAVLFVVSLTPAVLAESKVNTLSEGQSVRFSLDAGVIEVKGLDISANQAVFSLDGKQIRALRERESYTANGVKLTLQELIGTTRTGDESLIEFCLEHEDECVEDDALAEGQTRSYSIDGKTYEITVLLVADGSTKFLVNGEVIDALSEGERESLSGGVNINVRDVVSQSEQGNFIAEIRVEDVRTETSSYKITIAAEESSSSDDREIHEIQELIDDLDYGKANFDHFEDIEFSYRTYRSELFIVVYDGDIRAVVSDNADARHVSAATKIIGEYYDLDTSGVKVLPRGYVYLSSDVVGKDIWELFGEDEPRDDSDNRFWIKAEFEDGVTKVKVEYSNDDEVRYELETQDREEVVAQIARIEGLSKDEVLAVIRWEFSDDSNDDSDENTGHQSIKIDDPSSGALVSGAVRVKVEWDGRVEYAVITIKGAEGGELSERITTEQTVGFDLDTIKGAVAGITVRGFVDDEEVASDAIRVRLQEGADLNDDRLDSGHDVSVRDDTCAGCEDEELCYQIGTRVKQEGQSMYCEVDGTLQVQKTVGQSCENNFECSTNQCSSGACIDLSAELAENRSMMQRILSFIDRLFN